MGRLSGIGLPGRRRGVLSHNDSVPSIQTTTTTGEASGNIVKTSVFDGLGRPIQSQLNSDPQTVDKLDILQRPLGRAYSVSNPYRGFSVSAFSYSFYDDLDRPIRQISQDNSARTTSYAGNLTTGPTDENGNQWTRTSDGLGRLTQILEPNGTSKTPSMATNYTYDPLGNLTGATQHGSGSGPTVTRAFTYDKLARLLTANNPETGNSTYSYSVPGLACAADSSLPCTKTDARSVITTYGYNTINQLLSKTYTSAPAGTLSSCFAYGTSMPFVARLVAEWTQAGACPASAPSSGYQALRKILAYDPMGRIWNEQQCLSGQCRAGTSVTPPCSGSGNSSPFYLPYCYDLAGNLTYSTNGLPSTPGASTPVTFSQTFDAANRLSTITGSWSDTNHPSNLFTANGYTPASAIQNMLLGNKFTVIQTYDNRLRTIGSSATHP